MSNVRFEVRCCCNPYKLVGHVDVPVWLVGDVIQTRTFEVALAGSKQMARWIRSGEASYPENPDRLTLRLEELALVPLTRPDDQSSMQPSLHPTKWHRYMAFKGEEIPIDTLLRIPQFTQAEPERVSPLPSHYVDDYFKRSL